MILFALQSVEAQELEWAKQAGSRPASAGSALEEGTGIAVDGSGDSYVTGFFRESATFGAGEANETTFNSFGEEDIFVAKYNRRGKLLWAKQAGSSASGGVGVLEGGRGIAVDGSGDSYVTGLFFESATFGAGEANETTLNSSGREDIFVAKYNRRGKLLWAKQAGGSTNDIGEGIAVDGSGDSYVTGFFRNSATFGYFPTNVPNSP